jgi:hypothetical protein
MVDEHFGTSWSCEIEIDIVPIFTTDPDDRALGNASAGSLLTD